MRVYAVFAVAGLGALLLVGCLSDDSNSKTLVETTAAPVVLTIVSPSPTAIVSDAAGVAFPAPVEGMIFVGGPVFSEGNYTLYKSCSDKVGIVPIDEPCPTPRPDYEQIYQNIASEWKPNATEFNVTLKLGELVADGGGTYNYLIKTEKINEIAYKLDLIPIILDTSATGVVCRLSEYLDRSLEHSSPDDIVYTNTGGTVANLAYKPDKKTRYVDIEVECIQPNNAHVARASSTIRLKYPGE